MAKRAKRKEKGKPSSKEISNNILVLILIIIIFVSILGTLIIQQALQEVNSGAKTMQSGRAAGGGSGMVALTIRPSEDAKEKKGGSK